MWCAWRKERGKHEFLDPGQGETGKVGIPLNIYHLQ